MPSPLLVASLMLTVLMSACAGGEAAVHPVAPAPDTGADARAAVLARYGDGVPTVAQTTPAVVGRSPGSGESLLTELGLRMRVVAVDGRPIISRQHPPEGQPVPLDGVIEVWLGHRDTAAEPTRPEPEEVAIDHGEADTPVPATPPTPTPSPTEADALPMTTGQPLVTHILPPHTDGILRVNPRRLPAVPLGTELTGLASWYGPGFHGRTTACGGVYDQNGPTLATRELRCGTVVRITGPTGLTVEATVTDWGPAEWTGRRFDLSAAVFNAIAPLGAGVVPVRIVTANVPR